MATYKTRGIIINRHNLGEADRILTIATNDRGVVRAVAKGVRKIKSRMAGHLELFCESELMLAKGRNLDIITSARLQDAHAGIVRDYGKLQQAYLLAEMVQVLAGDDQHIPGLYELLQEAMTDLGGHEPGDVLELWFSLRLLEVLGYRPGLEACMVCGGDASDKSYYFSHDLGGIVDEDCALAGLEPMPQNGVKLWRVMMGSGLAAVRMVGGAQKMSASSLPICQAFYDYTFGKRFKSRELLA
jgi:DNA repair protein RecO (recombination protein O)